MKRCGRASPFSVGLFFASVLAVAVTGASSDATLRARAERLHRNAIVVDGHNDIPSVMLDSGFDLGERGDHADGLIYDFRKPQGIVAGRKFKTQTDLRRMKAGGIDAQFFSIYVNARSLNKTPANGGGAARRALDMIDALSAQVALRPDEMEMARTVGDIRRISRRGKIAALMGLEGGYAIEDSLAVLCAFHQLGVRYMTLTHTATHDWADSSGDLGEPGVRRHGGLTDFGREVVREMNRLGMMVDVSHASDETFWDVLKTTRAPVIASHSSCRALADHPRNLSDEMLGALARNGGVVMLNFADGFLEGRLVEFNQKLRALEIEMQRKHPSDPKAAVEECQKFYAANHPGRTPLARLIDHIEHAVRVAGISHVGVGSDFDGEITPPDGMEDVSKFPNITLELIKRGYSDEAIRKVLGGNLLRVMAEVERVGASKPPESNHGRSDK
jgi:membrane dipeptidase